MEHVHAPVGFRANRFYARQFFQPLPCRRVAHPHQLHPRDLDTDRLARGRALPGQRAAAERRRAGGDLARAEKGGIGLVLAELRKFEDARNAFAQDISYRKGTLPQMDDLIERSVLIPVPPILTAQACDRIIQIYRDTAAELGLR